MIFPTFVLLQYSKPLKLLQCLLLLVFVTFEVCRFWCLSLLMFVASDVCHSGVILFWYLSLLMFVTFDVCRSGVILFWCLSLLMLVASNVCCSDVCHSDVCLCTKFMEEKQVRKWFLQTYGDLELVEENHVRKLFRICGRNSCTKIISKLLRKLANLW